MNPDLDRRIQQFKQMAEADPENELGHFSLGKAYLDAGMFAEAKKPFFRALELNNGLSKAYQLLGETLAKSGDRAGAVDVLTRGVKVAEEQGDRMPREAMARQLAELGAQVPAPSANVRQSVPSGGTNAGSGFRCSRCGRPHGRLEKPPFKGALGEKVAQNVCLTCWREWIGMGTKVINELGLALSRPESQQTYDQYMVEFLQLEDK